MQALRTPEGAGDLMYELGWAVSRRARLGWASKGHSGVDVNLHAMGPEEAVSQLRGIRDNVDSSTVIAHFLGLDVDAVTARLAQMPAARWGDSETGDENSAYDERGFW